MQYHLNQIEDPKHFQRLVNAILTARFGEEVRLTPLHGTDGGSDGETAPLNPNMEFSCTVDSPLPNSPLAAPPHPGRYLFQAKYHRTGEHRPSDLRTLVVKEFEEELRNAVLRRRDRRDVNYFFLVTNVSASKDAIAKIDTVRKRLLRSRKNLHADVWWSERIIAFLDWSPDLWLAFPELFPGRVPPFLAQTLSQGTEGLARTFRLAIRHQYDRDLTVKFRQVELEQRLSDLFVDLDVELRAEAGDPFPVAIGESVQHLVHRYAATPNLLGNMRPPRFPSTALELIINDEFGIRRILLEGGPGQGKSTITQMAAQIYRQRLLRRGTPSGREVNWHQMCQTRFPIRVELRSLAEWLSSKPDGTLDEYIAHVVSKDAGGASVAVNEVHSFIERSSVILLLDGLDEIGSDLLRDTILDVVMITIKRFEEDLGADLRVVLTTRPPALAGRRDKLDGFSRVVLGPMEPRRIDDYLERWLAAQIKNSEERDRIRESFEGRRHDPHVDALARNPMQLSVLLQFIYLKGEAFPDRRAELYRDYFEKVIDRDVEKSRDLRKNRGLIEGLHSFLGFHFHGATEIGQGKRTWNRAEIVELAGRWLGREGHPRAVASHYFALGEERFGLIVALSGEGNETTYGFEVQPIQEYFAASYISNRLANGKAHEVFELLVHRSYWREVALFLAGLRRPNEKADLVGRAKTADQDPSRGWQQNGRSIVLQLLREGVFQEPRHVLKEAMDFVAELLDMKRLRVQRAPEGFVDTICQLSRLYPTNDFRNWLAELVESYNESDDEYALGIIHRVAARVLSTEKYTGLVLRYKGETPQGRAMVRMECPYESQDALPRLVGKAGYWRGVGWPIWARRVWRSALKHGVVSRTELPAQMHPCLLAEFATDYPVVRNGRDVVLEIRRSTPEAVWRLQQNIQAMRYGLAERTDTGMRTQRERRASREGGSPYGTKQHEVSYQGLETGPARCLADLVEATNVVVSALAGNDDEIVSQGIAAYLRVIKEHLSDSGIAGWMACRCAIEFLQRRWPIGRGSQVAELVDGVVETLTEYYVPEARSFALRYRLQRWALGMPNGVRLRPGAKVVPLYKIVADMLNGRLSETKRQLCSWIAYAPIPSGMIRPMVESCRDRLPELLRFVGERKVIGVGPRPRLRVQDTQRILKICRETEEEEVLNGGATMLLNAAFGRIAEPRVVAKLLAAAPGSQLVTRIFGAGREMFGEENNEMRKREWALSGRVAAMVLREPGRYPFRVVSGAAAFVAETERSQRRALFEERSDLVQAGGEES